MKRLLSVSIILMILVSMVVWVGVSTVEAGGVLKPPTCPPLIPTVDALIFCQLKEIKSLIQGIDCTNVTLRRYYLTQGQYQGDQTLTACAPGFHMANLFEILTLSGFSYDTTLGITSQDSGQGPPAAIAGWIRTGMPSQFGGGGMEGIVNCSAYTSKNSAHKGTTVSLNGFWGGPFETITPWWYPLVSQCDVLHSVWCVEDLNQ